MLEHVRRYHDYSCLALKPCETVDASSPYRLYLVAGCYVYRFLLTRSGLDLEINEILSRPWFWAIYSLI